MELSSLALVGFTLPIPRSPAVTARSSVIVADATTIAAALPTEYLPALFGGAAALALSRVSSSSDGLAEKSSVDADAPAATSEAVRSWYDSGIRLVPPVTSWYDRGIRLDKPLAPSPPPPSPPADAAAAPSAAADAAPSTSLAYHPGINELIIKERIGEGQQSEVLLGELPGADGPVAVKVGLKVKAIDREAVVLSVMSGVPGFPVMLHHEAAGISSGGGFLVLELLGPSLKELQPPDSRLSNQTLLRVGRGILRNLRRLHDAGFVHNDVKPANILLGAGAGLQPTKLHLIDFGSCTRADPDAAAAEGDTDRLGPIGTPNFASIAADDPQRLLRPVDDVESLAYTLTYMAAGCLPWQGKADEVTASMKRDLLIGEGGAEALTADVQCEVAAAALQALWEEVRRCHGEDDERADRANIDYDACLAALGAEAQDAEAEDDDTVSEFSLMSGGAATSEEEEADAEILAEFA